MRIAVVIPFYKNKEQLDRCLAALSGQVLKDDIFIIDDSDAENGFTATVNHGISLVRNYRYVVVLNQDCYLKPQAINAMLSFMDDHPRCAIAGIKQLSSIDTDRIIHGGTRTCFPLGVHIVGSVSLGECDTPIQVPWVNGACMIVRVASIVEFGLMDRTYKMFYSDSDWSLTARARGWECWYIPSAVCVHEVGTSKGAYLEDSPRYPVFRADQVYFYKKWLTDLLYQELCP